MNRAIKFTPGEYYHVFNRGVDKRIVFKDQADKLRFQRLLFLCNNEQVLHLSTLKEEMQMEDIYSIERGNPLVAIGPYCIMGSHFHLLLKEKIERGISRFVQKISTAYAMYFNIKNQRSGSLFESKFKAKHANNDRYLKYLFSYIHMNPAEHIEPEWKEKGALNKRKIWSYVSEYKFSSLQDFLAKNSRPEKNILSLEDFPAYFRTIGVVSQEIWDWLLMRPDNPPTY